MRSPIPSFLVACALLLSSCSSPSTGGGGKANKDSTGGGFGVDGKAAAGDGGAAGLDVAPSAQDVAPDDGGALADASVKDGGSSGALCVPNATQLCYCSAALQGVQECKSDATGWTKCDCSSSLPDTSTGLPDTGLEPLDLSEDDATGNCDERAKKMYVVSKEKVLLRVEIEKKQLIPIGTLNCPGAGSGTPFSMSIDRQANAWILYQSLFGSGGGIYKASTLDASCQATAYQPNQLGFELFGMGFSADDAFSQNETLWITGDLATQFSTNYGKLGRIVLSTMKVVSVAPLQGGPGSPDLTGTGLGDLYGFFPSSVPPSVKQIDKLDGSVLKSVPLPANIINSTEAWAFAFWGGKFYLYFKKFGDPSSHVYVLDPVSQNFSTFIDQTGYTITGAGVSSCAPLQ